MVVISTNLGEIKLKLFADKAPKTVENFLNHIESGFYKGTIFHRVIKGFMIQGGGFEAGLEQKSAGNPIENEANNSVSNNKGTIAMARTNDPHSATCQFFINTSDNDFLNFKSESMQGWGYCAFGEVVEGLEIVDKIDAVKTENTGFHQDVPVEDVVILDVTLAE